MVNHELDIDLNTTH